VAATNGEQRSRCHILPLRLAANAKAFMRLPGARNETARRFG
jgi:hypothetical protein